MLEREKHGACEKHPHRPVHLVEVVVDQTPRKVEAGSYLVSAFKREVGVPAEKELDQIVNGTITPLDDNATIVITGGEVFISHERTGGAS